MTTEAPVKARKMVRPDFTPEPKRIASLPPGEMFVVFVPTPTVAPVEPAKPIPADESQQAMFTRIIDESCCWYRVTREDLIGKSRHKRLVRAREMIAYIARELTTLSLTQINVGVYGSRSGHVSTLDAIRRITDRWDADDVTDHSAIRAALAGQGVQQ